MGYQETIKEVLERRTPAQIEKSKEIQARVERYNQQKDNLFKVREDKVNQMVNIFKPRIIDLTSN